MGVRGLLSLGLLPRDLRRNIGLVSDPISIIKLNGKQSIVFVVNSFVFMVYRKLLKGPLFNLLVELVGIVILEVGMHLHILIAY